MMRIKRSRVTTAVGVTTAMLVGLGGVGGAVAADLIGSKDIRNNTIRSVDVKDGGLALRDLNQAAKDKINRPGPAGKDGADGADGKDGADGANGERGPKGEPGDDGVSGLQAVMVTSDVWPVDPAPPPSVPEVRAPQQQVVARCAPGKAALGGGWRSPYEPGQNDGSELGREVLISASYPARVVDGTVFPADEDHKPNAWVVEGFNETEEEVTVDAFVVCASVN